jgi:hypothetical protein
MKYLDGQEVIIGDKILLDDGSKGEVVFCIDRDEFSDEYPREEWMYLGTGAMVKVEKYGLIHYPSNDGDLILVCRGK